MGQVQDEWLEDDTNLALWEDEKTTLSQRRILMTMWAADAHERWLQAIYDKVSELMR
jgi:hypothetical protein